MLDKNFTILLPIRRYEETFKMMINSVFKTTSDRSKIEILLAVDDDDEISLRMARKAQVKYSKDIIHIHVRPRSNSLVNHYYNWLALNFSKGKYLFIMNHDCLFKIKDWDVKCYEKLENYLKDKSDRIVMGLVKDGEVTYQNLFPAVSCFPILSREILDALGFVLDPHILRWDADRDITELFYSVYRVVDLRDICFAHHRAHEFAKLPKQIGGGISMEKWRKRTTFKVWEDKKPMFGDYKKERLKKLRTYIHEHGK